MAIPGSLPYFSPLPLGHSTFLSVSAANVLDLRKRARSMANMRRDGTLPDRIG